MSENIWYNISTAKAGEDVKNNYDGEVWTKLGPEHFANVIAKKSVRPNNSRIAFGGAVRSWCGYDNSECYIMALSGGLNGGDMPNKWCHYLSDISAILSRLEGVGHAWVIDLDNDCCDDVWDLTVGFTVNEDTQANETSDGKEDDAPAIPITCSITTKEAQ